MLPLVVVGALLACCRSPLGYTDRKHADCGGTMADATGLEAADVGEIGAEDLAGLMG